MNIRLGPDKVDFLWRHKRLIVEVDGSWRQLADDPAGIAATIRALLGPEGGRLRASRRPA